MLKQLALSLLLVASLLSAVAVAHPFHVTIAEAELNRKTGRLEVALRVQPIDLEDALRAQSRKPVNLDKDKDIDQRIVEYLKKTFVVRGKKGKPLAIKWVGKELEIKRAWLYFEVPLETNGELDQRVIENHVFHELLPDQINTVIFRDGKRKRTFHFTQKKSRRKIVLSDKREKDESKSAAD